MLGKDRPGYVWLGQVRSIQFSLAQVKWGSHRLVILDQVMSI